MAVAIGAALIGVGFIAACGHRQPPPRTETPTPTTPPVSTPVTPRNPTPLPAGLLDDKPAQRGKPEDCPTDWWFFDNLALHYTICFPSGWGFHDGDTVGPLDPSVIAARGFMGVIVFSEEWFPYPVGAGQYIEPEVARRLGDANRMRIDEASEGMGFEGCSPETPTVIGGVLGVFCIDTYGITSKGEAYFSPTAPMLGIKILLPLFNGPSGYAEPPGNRLHIKLVTPRRLYGERHDFLWKVLNTLRVYR